METVNQGVTRQIVIAIMNDLAQHDWLDFTPILDVRTGGDVVLKQAFFALPAGTPFKSETEAYDRLRTAYIDNFATTKARTLGLVA